MSAIRSRSFGAALLMLTSAPAVATTCASFPYTLTNGATADASQVMADFTAVGNCAASVAAPNFTGTADFATGAQSDVLIGQINNASGYNVLGLNGSVSGTAATGLIAGNASDKSLYIQEGDASSSI